MSLILPETILDSVEVLPFSQRVWTLSPSSLEAFLVCPRQFFYKAILNLPEAKTSVKPLFGSIVHQVLADERVTRFFDDVASPAEIGEYIRTILDDVFGEPSLVNRGLERLRLTVKGVSVVHRLQLRHNLEQAFSALVESGFFRFMRENYRLVNVEKSLAVSEAYGAKNITLKGRYDALFQSRQSQNRLLLLDYKTGLRSLYKSDFDKNTQALDKKLMLMADDMDLNQLDAWTFQLPLYWMLLRQQAAYASAELQIDVGLQFVRATSDEGSGLMKASHELIAAVQPVMSTLVNTVLAETLSSLSHFEPLADTSVCRQCSYESICERQASLDTAFDEGEA